MTRAILLGITTALLAASGCDPEGGSPDDETTFRQNVVYVAVKTQTSSFSAGSCDPDWWFVEACGAEFDEKEWRAMIEKQAAMMGEEMLMQLFLSNPEVEELCHHACDEAGRKWTGNVRATESEHDVGETEVVGECPFGLVATSTPTVSQGEMACECG